jgi:bis(5'-nucleosidyl)-tetraphosphatase
VSDGASPNLSAGVIVVRETALGPRFLLLRSYRYWDFPKGHVEQGESPLNAALRETREEAGIGELDFPWGEGFCETEPYAHGKVARYYVARTPSPHVTLGINPDLGRPEHHEYRWVTAARAHALLNTRLRRVLGWAVAAMGGEPPVDAGGDERAGQG